MKVFSLSSKPGEPRYCQSLQVNYWFWERGYEVIQFERIELLTGKLDRYLHEEHEDTIVYGAVAVVRDALQRANRPAPPNIDFPTELQGFLGRKISECSMGSVRELVHNRSDILPIHIKPRDRQKLFKGRIVHNVADLIESSGVSDDEPVIMQEIVNFISEWRATVLRGVVVNISNYKGNPMCFPNPEIVNQAVLRYGTQPIGYGIDWGVTDSGQTLLVEVNDGFALGNYGTKGYLYTAMIECRWRQLMGLPDNGVGWEP
jgi:hypothetical protein